MPTGAYAIIPAIAENVHGEDKDNESGVRRGLSFGTVGRSAGDGPVSGLCVRLFTPCLWDGSEMT